MIEMQLNSLKTVEKYLRYRRSDQWRSELLGNQAWGAWASGKEQIYPSGCCSTSQQRSGRWLSGT